jgi:hypothetical protein
MQCWCCICVADLQTELDVCDTGDNWTYDPNISPATKIDVAHVIQIQFQLQATGAEIGFLCSWSVRNGVRFFSVKYSERFMQCASQVLKEVTSKYLQQGKRSLPSCVITSESEALQESWHSMMEALTRVEVKDLGPPGTALFNSQMALP